MTVAIDPERSTATVAAAGMTGVLFVQTFRRAGASD
jgi:threonine dehydrogenase-like Zn-dependent dehydrogenase